MMEGMEPQWDLGANLLKAPNDNGEKGKDRQIIKH
jgi:hypothetical protein